MLSLVKYDINPHRHVCAVLKCSALFNTMIYSVVFINQNQHDVKPFWRELEVTG